MYVIVFVSLCVCVCVCMCLCVCLYEMVYLHTLCLMMSSGRKTAILINKVTHTNTHTHTPTNTHAHTCPCKYLIYVCKDTKNIV